MKCTKCNLEKPNSEFYTRKTTKKGYVSHCKCCHIKHMKSKHNSIKLTLTEMFGNKCVRCGYHQEPRILQFHHKNPLTKKFSISEKCRYSIKGLIEEAKKCELLCPNCHALHHLS